MTADDRGPVAMSEERREWERDLLWQVVTTAGASGLDPVDLLAFVSTAVISARRNPCPLPTGRDLEESPPTCDGTADCQATDSHMLCCPSPIRGLDQEAR